MIATDCAMVTGPYPAESSTRTVPPDDVCATAAPKLRHGAVRLQGLVSTPVEATNVRFDAAFAIEAMPKAMPVTMTRRFIRDSCEPGIIVHFAVNVFVNAPSVPLKESVFVFTTYVLSPRRVHNRPPLTPVVLCVMIVFEMSATTATGPGVRIPTALSVTVQRSIVTFVDPVSM